MTDKVAIRLLETGVPGLDAILGGGLPEFSFNLIAGTPGSGKTTLAHQIMFALGESGAAGAVLHGAGRAGIEDAALSTAILVLRHRQNQPVDPLRQPGGRGGEERSGSSVGAHRGGGRSVLSQPRLRGFVSLRHAGDATRARASQQFAAVRAAAGHANDELAGHHFSWSVNIWSTESEASPVFTVADGMLWLSPKFAPQFNGSQDASRQNARPGDQSGPAYLPDH